MKFLIQAILGSVFYLAGYGLVLLFHIPGIWIYFTGWTFGILALGISHSVLK